MQSVTLAICIGLIACLARLLLVGRRPKGYPPGPPTIPILGNIHQMPPRDAHLQFQKWAQEYGPIYSLMLGTQTLIVLSSDEVVKELLDKRSNNYSDRMDMYIGQTLCSDGLRLLMMGYGPRWRTYRKMVHALLNIHAAKAYVPYQILENKQMLYQFLNEPADFLKHIRRYSNALTTTMVFGWRTPTYEDAKMKQLFDGFSEFSDINQTGAAALLDSFPVLRSLPDSILPTQKKAKELHRHERQLYLSHWLTAKSAYAEGALTPCFCVGMAEAQKRDGFDDAQAAYISGTLLEAGSDTTSSTLYAFVQAMLLYPDAQRTAQAEIDRVIGHDRLPTMEDEQSLPYVRACMKETLRWMPTTILGAVPHAATKADTFMGYTIPAGAGIMNNVWAINMDPKRAPEPRKYKPERYLHDTQSLYESAASPDGAKRDQFTFGAGRRICPGMHVAERSLFLAMSRLLSAFSFLPVADGPSGEPVLPDEERLTQGFVCMPEEYTVKIVPRSELKAALIRQEWQQAEAQLLDKETKQWKESPIDVESVKAMKA